MGIKKLFKLFGKAVTTVTGKPTTTASVVGEVAHVVAKRTGVVDPETAEAVAEAGVKSFKSKRRSKPRNQ